MTLEFLPAIEATAPSDTWKQLRKTALMVWALGMASYLIVVQGGTADAAIAVANTVATAVAARFVE